MLCRKTTGCIIIISIFLLFMYSILLKNTKILAPREYSYGRNNRSAAKLMESAFTTVPKKAPKLYGNERSETKLPSMKVPKLSTSTSNKEHSKTKLPSITLTLRMSSTPKLLKFFYCDLLRSTSLYWSKQLGSMTVILDKESPEDKALAEHLAKDQQSLGINFNFVYEPMPDRRILKFPTQYHKPWQYNRQLYSSFLMDELIKEDVIAWIDTDAKFITPVTKENIVKDGKLRVKGLDSFSNPWLSDWDKQTKVMVGYNMPSDFMTYFPAYIWRDTITNCRKHILKHMKAKNIDEAYQSAARRGSLSPVNIFLTYAYYFERHRYDWHIDITPTATGKETTFKEYNRVHLAKGHELNNSHTIPEVHVTLHTKYYIETRNINKHAYCAASNNTSISSPKLIKEQCKGFNGNLMWSLFEFCNKPIQGHLKTWCKKDNKKCVSLINEHYKHTRQAINEGMYKLDLSSVKAIDDSAKQMNITCPKFM